MSVSARLRRGVDLACGRILDLLAPEGRPLEQARIETIWKPLTRSPAAAALERAARPFASTLARRLETGTCDAEQLRSMRRRGALPYAVIGDSHGAHLIRRASRGDRWLLPLHWACEAASARGLLNSEGRSGAAETVRRAFSVLERLEAPVILKFGQVDVEFVHAFKRIEGGDRTFDEADFEAFSADSAARYAEAIDRLAPPSIRPRLIVASVFPPSLSDAAWARGYVNAAVSDLHASGDRKALEAGVKALQIPSMPVRTRLHDQFNTQLKAAAAGLGVGYLDAFHPLLGADGLLKATYRGAGGADHHLAFQASRKAIIAALWQALDE